jgi:hypothetical protein
VTTGGATHRYRGVRPALAMLVILWTAPLARSQDESAAYVGVENCRLCHRAIYQSWLETPHARTRLAPDADQRCWRCHATVRGRLEGVQCESCHGGGVNYWPAEVMIDPDKAAMAGLKRPSLDTCTRCHGSGEAGHASTFTMPPRVEWPRWIHTMEELDR